MGLGFCNVHFGFLILGDDGGVHMYTYAIYFKLAGSVIIPGIVKALTYCGSEKMGPYCSLLSRLERLFYGI